MAVLAIEVAVDVTGEETWFADERDRASLRAATQIARAGEERRSRPWRSTREV
ncbi:MAG TPA: hypothetical protein VFK02_06650 [Kofleriaceae bacterium]|nr:hypothetical protein [Kofleriaceae bacterium]